MDSSPPAPQDHAAAAVETAWQLASSALQLLSMLDVVQQWSLEDADHLADLAEQADRLSVLAAARTPPTTPEQAKRIAKVLDAGSWRAHRLLPAVQAQARDKASAAGVESALRRLGDALERLRRALGLVPADDDGA